MIELIAEIGSVHDGSFGNAVKLIELAKEVGANAVKIQMHIAEEESLRNAPNHIILMERIGIAILREPLLVF